MTAALVMLALIVLVDVLTGVQMFRRNRPAQLPRSRRDWSSGLPSSSYTPQH